MDIRRFGVGYRRREGGMPGTKGVAGRGIHNDDRGHIAELAFDRDASVPVHSNPNTTWFIVIEGGGFVRVGEETARVAAGEAVLWPADVLHGVWTEQSPMRAIVVEFAGAADLAHGRARLLEGQATHIPVEPVATAADEADDASLRADGALAPRPTVDQADHVSLDEEPW